MSYLVAVPRGIRIAEYLNRNTDRIRRPFHVHHGTIW